MSRYTTSESIDSYMEKINRIGRIDRDEERRLARIIRGGGGDAERLSARDRLVCANLRLVVKIAHDFKKYGVGLADLVAEGNRGLMTAAEKFDPDNGAKFSVYAGWWIKQSMRRAIQWQCRLIRVPGGTGQRSINVRKAADKWLAEHGEAATAAQLAEATGYGEQSVVSLLESVPETVSLSEPVSGDSETTYGDLVDAGDAAVQEECRGRLRERLLEALGGLTRLDRFIVCRSFGLDGPQLDARRLAQEAGLPPKLLRDRLAGVLCRLRQALLEDDATA